MKMTMKQKNSTISYFGIMAEGKFDLKLVPEYNGTTLVVDWLERIDLICKLLGVNEVKQTIPRRLAGGTSKSISNCQMQMRPM